MRQCSNTGTTLRYQVMRRTSIHLISYRRCLMPPPCHRCLTPTHLATAACARPTRCLPADPQLHDVLPGTSRTASRSHAAAAASFTRFHPPSRDLLDGLRHKLNVCRMPRRGVRPLPEVPLDQQREQLGVENLRSRGAGDRGHRKETIKGAEINKRERLCGATVSPPPLFPPPPWVSSPPDVRPSTASGRARRGDAPR